MTTKDEQKRPTVDTKRPAAVDTKRPAAVDTKRPAAVDTKRPAAVDMKRPAGKRRPGEGAEESATKGANGRDFPARTIAALAAIVAVIAALGCVAFFGYRAYEVYAVQYPIQEARDGATSSAEQAMLNVTTIDPKDMTGFDQRLESSFAEDALTQVRQQVVATLDPQLKQAGEQVGSTTSRVVRSAPTEVNADDGTAQVLVYVAVSGQSPGQAAATPNTMGFLVGMKKFDDTWKAVKVSPLDGISYSDEAAGGSQTPSSQTPAPQAPAGGN